jgi:hypothetical protein
MKLSHCNPGKIKSLQQCLQQPKRGEKPAIALHGGMLARVSGLMTKRHVPAASLSVLMLPRAVQTDAMKGDALIGPFRFGCSSPFASGFFEAAWRLPCSRKTPIVSDE